jgi:hypothetical protein
MENVLPHLVAGSVRFKDRQQCGSSQQRILSKKKLHPYPTSNAEIMQPYLLVCCVTNEKERADETEDRTCPYPSYARCLQHYALKRHKVERHY